MGMATPDEADAYKMRKGIGYSWDVKKLSVMARKILVEISFRCWRLRSTRA